MRKSSDLYEFSRILQSTVSRRFSLKMHRNKHKSRLTDKFCIGSHFRIFRQLFDGILNWTYTANFVYATTRNYNRWFVCVISTTTKQIEWTICDSCRNACLALIDTFLVFSWACMCVFVMYSKHRRKHPQLIRNLLSMKLMNAIIWISTRPWNDCYFVKYVQSNASIDRVKNSVHVACAS